MTEQEVIALIADAIMVTPDQLTAASQAKDLPDTWDSMGTLNIMLSLDDQGVKLAPGETGHLQSVEGVIGLVRKAGKLS